MRPIDVVTDDAAVGDRFAEELRAAGFENVRVVLDLPEDCTVCRVTADDAGWTSGLPERLTRAADAAFARIFGDEHPDMSFRRVTAQSFGKIAPEQAAYERTLRVQLPMRHVRARDEERRALATAPQYRLSVWGLEDQAHDTLRHLKYLKFDYELGPSKWEGEQGVILYGGAPTALIDKILQIVSDKIWIVLRKNSCWAPENNEIRVLLPPPYRLSVWGQAEAARETLGRLKHAMFDGKLGPRTWDSERGVIEYRGAPEALIDRIERIVAATCVIDVRREICPTLGDDEIRVRLPELWLPTAVRREAANGKYTSWATHLSADQMRAVLWAAGELGARLDGEARWAARDRKVIIPPRVDIGLAAIRRAVTGRPVTVLELTEAIRGEALESGAGVAEAQDAAVASILKTAAWARRLEDDQLTALLWAIGEIGLRISEDFKIDPSQLRGDADRANVAVGALDRAVTGKALSMADLEAAFRARA